MGAELVLPLVLHIPPCPSLTLLLAHPPQNASQDLLGETLAQLIRQQFDGRGDHQLSHYSLAEAWGHGTGMSHVCAGGGWQRRGCHQHHQHTVRGAWGKAGGLTPLLDLQSPSPMSPHLSPWGRTLLLPFVSSSISKEAPTPDISGWKGYCWGGPESRLTWEWAASLRRVP